jgi:hypothetical protein
VVAPSAKTEPICAYYCDRVCERLVELKQIDEKVLVLDNGKKWEGRGFLNTTIWKAAAARIVSPVDSPKLALSYVSRKGVRTGAPIVLFPWLEMIARAVLQVT